MMNQFEVFGRYVNASVAVWDTDKGCMVCVAILGWKQIPAEYDPDSMTLAQIQYQEYLNELETDAE